MNYTKLFNNIKNNNILLINIFRNYAFKSDLKIKWVRPEKIPSYKSQKSGDLKPMPKIDEKELVLEYRNSKELETANDLVRRLFTLEFAPRNKMTALYKRSIQETVCSHGYDDNSMEVKIAKWTGTIRSMQELMKNYPRNKVVKVILKEMIDKRKKNLKFLRMWDYKKFEWLLENLDLVYKPPPQIYETVTRKRSLTKLTDKYCEDIRNEKLNELKLKLQEEQPAFLEEKIRILQFIRDEQRDCGVEVTVQEEDIDEVKQKLEVLRAKQQSEE